LLGYPVSEDEAVSIKRLSPAIVTASKLSPDARIAALKALSERLAGPEANADAEEAAANEALRSTRPNYLPVG
jgi:hypothetical protein